MLGGHSLKDRIGSFAAVPIKRWIIHPEATDFALNRTRGNWDINESVIIWDYAILVLQSEVMLTKQIQPICLPPPQTPNTINMYDNQVAYTYGWGLTELVRYGNGPFDYNETSPSYFPKRANLTIIPVDECANKWKAQTSDKIPFEIPGKLAILCALGVPYNISYVEDACFMDSGGNIHIEFIVQYSKLGILQSTN